MREQKQPGYAVASVKVPQGDLTGAQMRNLSQIATDAGDGLLRVAMNQNVLLAFVPVVHLKRVYAALREAGLAGASAPPDPSGVVADGEVGRGNQGGLHDGLNSRHDVGV